MLRKHITDKYVIAFMYFLDIDDKEQVVRALITKEIHLMNNFKTNVLIKNDVLNLKLIDVSTFKDLAYIESCDVIIFIRL